MAILNADNEIFMVHVPALAEQTTTPIHSSCQAQVALLISDKNEILTEYSNFSNLFSLDSAVKLPEHTRINDHSINLLNNKQLPYGPIYSLRLIELKLLKTYIKANLANSFINSSKSLSSILILFV